MIIDYDHNPQATAEQKTHSLMESVQMAFNIVPTEPITKQDLIKLDGIEALGTSHSSGGGSGGGSSGTTDYNDLINKPSIEGVTLFGNNTFPNLNLNVLTNTEIQEIFDNLI